MLRLPIILITNSPIPILLVSTLSLLLMHFHHSFVIFHLWSINTKVALSMGRRNFVMPTLLKKCGQYESYRATGIEQHEHGAFPLVLWLFSKPERADALEQAIHRSPRFTPQLYRFATADTFNEVIKEPLS